MKKHLSIILIIISTLFISACTPKNVEVKKESQKVEVKTQYDKQFKGIMILDKAKLLQNQMKEDTVGNTEGTITYKLDDNTKKLDELVAVVITKSDKAMWDIKEIKNDKTPNSKYIQFTPKDKTIKSITTMTLTSIKDSKKVMIILSSNF